MQTVMWNKRKIFAIAIASMLIYTALRKKSYSYKLETTLPNVKAQTLWEFLADFSNTKKYLVPHITQFSILAESGNYDHWRYSVSYEEPLPLWPHLLSVAVGHYSVTTDSHGYLVSSTHNTCFFRGLMCSNSQCNFHISQMNNGDALYKEEIIYECPPLLGAWCRQAAEYTRQDFLKNLKNHFKTKS